MDITEESLRKLRPTIYPAGSGPLSMMRMSIQLMDYIANEKGWDIGQIDDPYPPVRKK